MLADDFESFFDDTVIKKVLRVVSPSLIIYSQFSTVLMDEHCLKVKKLV